MFCPQQRSNSVVIECIAPDAVDGVGGDNDQTSALYCALGSLEAATSFGLVSAIVNCAYECYYAFLVCAARMPVTNLSRPAKSLCISASVKP